MCHSLIVNQLIKSVWFMWITGWEVVTKLWKQEMWAKWQRGADPDIHQPAFDTVGVPGSSLAWQWHGLSAVKDPTLYQYMCHTYILILVGAVRVLCLLTSSCLMGKLDWMSGPLDEEESKSNLYASDNVCKTKRSLGGLILIDFQNQGRVDKVSLALWQPWPNV